MKQPNQAMRKKHYTETQPIAFEEDGEDQPGKSIIYLLGEHFVFNFVNTVQILPTLLPSIPFRQSGNFPCNRVFREPTGCSMENGSWEYFFLFCIGFPGSRHQLQRPA